eukprot:contig_11673_g2775
MVKHFKADFLRRPNAVEMQRIASEYEDLGFLGSIGMLYASALFHSIRLGSWPPSRPQTTIAGFSLTWFYNLTDGIYPDWRVFIKTYTNPKSSREKNFGRQQEAVQKAVERFFGELSRKYRMLRNPCSLW